MSGGAIPGRSGTLNNMKTKLGMLVYLMGVILGCMLMSVPTACMFGLVDNYNSSAWAVGVVLVFVGLLVLYVIGLVMYDYED